MIPAFLWEANGKYVSKPYSNDASIFEENKWQTSDKIISKRFKYF